MPKETTIKLSRDFKNWLTKQGVKGDTYQDILVKIIKDLPSEKMEKYLKESGYSYEQTAKIFGLRTKREKR